MNSMAKKHVKAMAIVKMNVLQSAMEVVANGMMGNVGQLLLRIHVQVGRLIVFTTSFFFFAICNLNNGFYFEGT